MTSRHTPSTLAAVVAMIVLFVPASATLAETVPEWLSETGLYADITTQTVAADHLPYTPQYPLWSDGATKRRWIFLPEGSSIDASNADLWVFPAGTRLFKEFSVGSRLETRMIQREGDGGWTFAAYVWNEDGKDARLAPTRGVRALREIQPGVTWDVPGRYDCLACHGDPTTPVLGFTLLQLSPDRDALAPHREAVDGPDLAQLVAWGWIKNLPVSDAWPRITAASAQERALRGYLYANCGNCHNERSSLADVGLFLDQARADDLRDPRILERIATDDPTRRMPPLGTRVVDAEALTLLESWLAANPPLSTTTVDSKETNP